MNSKDLKEFTKKANEATKRKTASDRSAYNKQRAKAVIEKKMFEQWDANGRKRDDPLRKELMSSLENVVQREANKRVQGTGGTIPQSAVASRLRVYADKALRTYDPDKGTKLTTHVINQFQPITSDVARWRNLQRIPKHRIGYVQSFTNAREELEQALGRPPNLTEMQTALPHISKTNVKNLMREVRAENFSDLVTEHTPDSPRTSAWELRQKYMLMKSTLPDDVKEFGNHHFPPPGTRQPTIKEIADRMKITKERAYKLKLKLEGKLGKV